MKEKPKLFALIVLAVVAVIVWRSVWNKQMPADQPVTALQNIKLLAEENPSIRWKELHDAQSTEYKSNGRNPFSTIAPPTAAEIKVKEAADKARIADLQKIPVVTAPPPPTIAQLPPNLKYFGYGTVPNGSPRRAFFTDGEKVYIVPEGDTLLDRFRILKVGNANIEFQEISTGLRGTAILEEPAAAPSV